MKTVLTLLNNIHPLSGSLTQYLVEKVKTVDIERKEFLLQAGNISRHIYFVEKGLIRAYYIQGTQEISSRFMKEGDIIVSASSFLLQKESDEYIQAIEDSQLLSLCYDELQHIYAHHMESNIISRVLITGSYLRSEQRLCLIRMKQASDRYKIMLEHFPDLVLRVPAKYLASYLGISEETLSRIRGRKY